MMKATVGLGGEVRVSRWVLLGGSGRGGGMLCRQGGSDGQAGFSWEEERKLCASDPLLSSAAVALGQTNETGTSLGGSEVAAAGLSAWMCEWAWWPPGHQIWGLARAGSCSWLCFSPPYLLALSLHEPHNKVTLKFMPLGSLDLPHHLLDSPDF